MSRPRVSVIVPNYNNGRTSSEDGQRDFLGELLSSLERTLRDDPELLEILIADDGSDDDSLETARAWSRRTRPDGRPFLRLIELEHCGVLSRVLNRLLREARGEIIARLDGDLVLRTPRWASLLCARFDPDPSVGVITGLQLLPDGTVHALGDDLWSPRGYRHVARGAPIAMLRDDREVDHAMGCFYATRAAVRETAGAYDESVLRGQTEEYGVRVRLAGWKVLATPSIVFEHWHRERSPRKNVADRPESLDQSLDRFRERWGFDRLAPDLAVVRSRYQGTPLWWRDHAARGAEVPPDEWERLGSDPAIAARLAEEAELLASASRAASAACRITVVGSGCGCLGHATARAGAAFEGFEVRGAAADAAARSVSRLGQDRRGTAPRFHAVEDLAKLPLEDQSRPLVAIFGTLERYWNPVGLLLECHRIVQESGVVLVRTRLRPQAMDEPERPGHPFTAEELLTLLRHVGGLQLVGFAPQVTSSGWLECCMKRGPREAGRGYFSRAWGETTRASSVETSEAEVS